jgi:Rps23 Pro-64 3,4-dihydroxylase Tpa1-like proline 4-hydroxylase
MSTPSPAVSTSIGEQISSVLEREGPRLRAMWQQSSPVRHFFVDDLLPEEQVLALFRSMPPADSLMLKRSLRESKRVGVSLDRYDPAVGAHLLAFQDPRVLSAITAITGLREMHADPSLYASGISVMQKDDFLNPHLDNSHDGDQANYRVLNLLFYASPGWRLDHGGNLELWTPRLDKPVVIESRFNRLVVMETDDRSWHSVQRVTVDTPRVCLSNYYFSPLPPGDHEFRNVTSFRGRPEEPVKRMLLRFDSALLNFVGRTLPFLVRRNPHRRN